MANQARNMLSRLEIPLEPANAVFGVPARKLKPIISPDALFQAANAAFTVGIRGLEKYKRGVYAFPAFSNSR